MPNTRYAERTTVSAGPDGTPVTVAALMERGAIPRGIMLALASGADDAA